MRRKPEPWSEGLRKRQCKVMKKIAIVSLGYFWTPVEAGPTRFFQIAMTFCKAGYEVEVITTGFQHFKKCPRDKEKIENANYPFRITFIDVPSYRKNIDLRRIYSNRIAARNVRTYMAEHIGEYAAVYCSIPANNVAAEVAVVCHRNSVPCVIDIEDLWPEAMGMIVKNERLRQFLLGSFRRDAETAYRYADGIIGTSEDYTARAFVNRPKEIPSDTVYVGCDMEEFDRGVQKYSDEINKPEGEFWVTYAGSISTSYDIKTLLLAAKSLLDEGHDEIKVQILGTGSQKEELEALTRAEKIKNVKFWGFIAYPKMAATLGKSDLLVNSFIKGAPQSIVNKVGDYLASGKPMINTLENPVFRRLVSRYEVGWNIVPENVQILSNAILELKERDAERKRMGRNARRLAETEFDRSTSYKKIVRMVEKCITMGQ